LAGDVASSAEAAGAWDGPAVLGLGCRPFFLGGALWAASAMALWVPMIAGRLDLPSRFAPVDWHIHELLYGYVSATVAGFLLTAVPNWTGRPPVRGLPLLGLFLLWLAGRVAIFSSAAIGAVPAAVVDLAFLAVLAMVVVREVALGRNQRNYKVAAILLVLFAANAAFHLEAAAGIGEGYGIRGGIGATIMLIVLIGGRVVPSFTRAYLVKLGGDRLPAPFGRFDVVAAIVAGITLFLWVAAPGHPLTGLVAILAGLVHFGRLGRWRGERTVGEPLLLVLHVAYLFVPVGFLLVGIALFRPDTVPQSAAIHAWTAGAIGMMTLSVMARASLGHTGRPLVATWPVTAVFGFALLAGVLRIVASLLHDTGTLLHLSALAWILAFAGFAVAVGPMLLRPRLDEG